NGAMSNAINEIDNTDLVFIFGYYPADSHPIVAHARVRRQPHGGQILVLVSPQNSNPAISEFHQGPQKRWHPASNKNIPRPPTRLGVCIGGAPLH
ncbi:hypothetical protein ACVGWC_03085, partial [Enterobacter hormaechei]